MPEFHGRLPRTARAVSVLVPYVGDKKIFEAVVKPAEGGSPDDRLLHAALGAAAIAGKYYVLGVMGYAVYVINRL